MVLWCQIIAQPLFKTALFVYVVNISSQERYFLDIYFMSIVDKIYALMVLWQLLSIPFTYFESCTSPYC